ncbi:MAG: hypothetical protein EPO21_24695 [Chloroflexota bacterium]|nr:MAG: hypothetical protein EPO21_24695 [Chloroflexota bacterium]
MASQSDRRKQGGHKSGFPWENYSPRERSVIWVDQDEYNEVMAYPAGGLPGVRPKLVGLYCVVDDSPQNVSREINFYVPFQSIVLQFPHFHGTVLAKCITPLSADRAGDTLIVFGYYCWQDETNTPQNCKFGDLLVVRLDWLSNGTRAKLTIQWADMGPTRQYATNVLGHILQCWSHVLPQIAKPMGSLGLIWPAPVPAALPGGPSADPEAPTPSCLARPDDAEIEWPQQWEDVFVRLLRGGPDEAALDEFTVSKSDIARELGITVNGVSKRFAAMSKSMGKAVGMNAVKRRIAQLRIQAFANQ